mmetsp:Transcript_1472/g.1548  ORF Transcript_1472/g.1548 Transcript_1472/m.1548 type:complete len:188 (-) Transcript_1472:170-733(-)
MIALSILLLLHFTAPAAAFHYSSLNGVRPNILRRTKCYGITPNRDESMDQYRKAIINTINTLQEETKDDSKLGGRQFLEIIIRKWGVPYDITIKKAAVFGEGSGNVYINVMWRYFGQKSFPNSEREYLENLEAIGRYITALGKVEEFKNKIKASRKRPNAYFGYAVSFPLDVDPSTADKFFKDLPYE